MRSIHPHKCQRKPRGTRTAHSLGSGRGGAYSRPHRDRRRLASQYVTGAETVHEALSTWGGPSRTFCVLTQFLRAEPRSHCCDPLRLPLPASHCNAATADRTVTSHHSFCNTTHAVAGLATEKEKLIMVTACRSNIERVQVAEHYFKTCAHPALPRCSSIRLLRCPSPAPLIPLGHGRRSALPPTTGRLGLVMRITI